MASHRLVPICRTCGKPETAILSKEEAEKRGYCVCGYRAVELLKAANQRLNEEIEVIDLIRATGIPYHSKCGVHGCKTCKR